MHNFELTWLKFGIVMKQFKLKHSETVLLPASKVEHPQSVLLTTSNKNNEINNVSMLSDIYKPVWFKLSMMIDTTEHYILILFYVTLTFIQGHRDARKQQLLHNLSSTAIKGFGWNLVCC